MHSPEKNRGRFEDGSAKQSSSFLTTTTSLSSELLKEKPILPQGSRPISNFVSHLTKKRSSDCFSQQAPPGPKPPKRVARRPRKESSLKQICTCILRSFILSQRSEIRLNKFASELKVERRRIYDIVNVLEGFDVVRKKGKNLYQWRGLEGFQKALLRLQATAKAEIPELKVFSFEHKDPRVKKKSLTFLSIKLLKLFIIYRENINFKELIKLFGQKYLQLKLNSEDKDLKKSENKNKIRRLYDIVNVFKSLGLIEKVVNCSGKSVFKFKGVDGLLDNVRKLRDPSDAAPRPSSPAHDLVRVVVFNDLNSSKTTIDREGLFQDSRRAQRPPHRESPSPTRHVKRIKTKSMFFDEMEHSTSRSRASPQPVLSANPLHVLDSLFESIDQKRELIPEALAKLKLTANNRVISVIGSQLNLRKKRALNKVPLLRVKHLDSSLQERLRQNESNQKTSSKDFLNLNVGNISCESENRFSDLKQKLLTVKIQKLTNTLRDIQTNYFETQHAPFFDTVCSCMSRLHLFV